MLTLYLSMLDEESDKDDFAALYERCKGRALHLALALVRERALAEDAVHEGFLYLAENYQRLSRKYTQGLDGYFFQCVECRAKNILRTRKREASFDAQNDFPSLAVDVNPEMQIAAQARLEQVVAIIQGLPEKYRSVLELYCTGWTVEQIAQAEGMTKGAVQKRLERARKMVRTAAGDENG